MADFNCNLFSCSMGVNYVLNNYDSVLWFQTTSIYNCKQLLRHQWLIIYSRCFGFLHSKHNLMAPSEWAVVVTVCGHNTNPLKELWLVPIVLFNALEGKV